MTIHEFRVFWVLLLVAAVMLAYTGYHEHDLESLVIALLTTFGLGWLYRFTND